MSSLYRESTDSLIASIMLYTRDIQLFSGATECSDQYYVSCGHEFKNT